MILHNLLSEPVCYDCIAEQHIVCHATCCLNRTKQVRCVWQGDLQHAIGDYHKALGLRPEDTFTAEMLAIALQDEAIPAELEGDDVFG